MHFLKSTLILLSILPFAVSSQNTVGTLVNTSGSFDGYTLYSPRTNEIPRFTYLINNCGEIINTWESEFPLFSKDLLMEDGTLYRSVVDNQSTLNIPGNTGRIEHLDWDGTLIWGLTYSDTDFSFHHDFEVLENGNIIMLVAERRSAAEAIENGRDPSTIATNELYEETLVEIEPVGQDQFNIVWQWKSWDHLIQDFDNTKQNFGIIANNPGLVNINYAVAAGEADWWHSNAISYNSDRDQVIISNRDLDEFIIIDHSTTTAEAATNTGGNSNRGGNILYRYGNPEAYDQGTIDDRQLNAQHNVQFIPAGSPNEGKILIFNNQPQLGFTSIQIINPEYDETTSNYVYNGGAYGPDTVDYEYVDPTDPSNFFAAFLSGAQELPNGNILIDNGPAGFLFEIDPSSNNETVWEYQNPVSAGGVLSDGDDPSLVQTFVFRALRYPTDYPAFDGRDLTPQGVIELNPADFDCSILNTEDFIDSNTVQMWPNPASDYLEIQSQDSFDSIELYDLKGRFITSIQKSRQDISHLSSGIYIVKLTRGDQALTKKIIKN